jgi:hypothetical protein
VYWQDVRIVTVRSVTRATMLTVKVAIIVGGAHRLHFFWLKYQDIFTLFYVGTFIQQAV